VQPVQAKMQALAIPNITAELKQNLMDGVARAEAGGAVDQIAHDVNRVVAEQHMLRGLDSKGAPVKSDRPMGPTRRAVVGANA